MENSGSYPGVLARAVGLRISQTKPGPNMPDAVARNCSRNESIEEKDCDRRSLRRDDIGGGVGDYASVPNELPTVDSQES